MTSTSTTLPAPAPARASIFHIDPRYLPPILITFILVVANAAFRGLEGLDKTLLAIVTSIATEVVLSKLTRNRWPNAASAYISGISVGILVRSPFFWPYALCSAIAITSKYALRLNGRHIWNPSNFAIALMVIVAHNSLATLSIQWDNRPYVVLLIWTVGAIIIGRLRRFHICLTYVLSFLAFSFVRHLITGDTFYAEVAPITGPMYQLFVFFMITDPPTTVKGTRPQMVVAFLVAAMEFVIRTLGGLGLDWGTMSEIIERISVHAPYYALFTVGPIAFVGQMLWLERKAKARVGVDGMAAG